MFIQRNLADIVDTLQASARKLFQGMLFYLSPGQTLVENDTISRITKSNPHFTDFPPLVFHGPTEHCNLIAAAMRHSNVPVQIIQTPYAFQIQREISLFYPELTLRCASWDFRQTVGKRPNHEDNLNFLFVDEPDAYCNWERERLEISRDNLSLNIWKKYFDEVLLAEEENKKFIDFLSEKPYFAIQVKYDPEYNANIWNGSAQPIMNEDYIPLLTYLRDKGLRIIQLGREPLPEIFQQYGVIHYPSTPYCSFKNDFLLAGLAEGAMIVSSGIGHLYDFLRVPTVSINHWHINSMTYSNFRILPARLLDTQTNTILNFREQMNAYKNIVKPQAHVFSLQNRYTALRNPPEMIRDSVVELLEPSFERVTRSDIIRLKAAAQDPLKLWGITDARLSICIEDYYPGYL
jgi:putative glycosyltransferase (TIGR04372 family)